MPRRRRALPPGPGLRRGRRLVRRRRPARRPRRARHRGRGRPRHRRVGGDGPAARRTARTPDHPTSRWRGPVRRRPLRPGPAGVSRRDRLRRRDRPAHRARGVLHGRPPAPAGRVTATGDTRFLDPTGAGPLATDAGLATRRDGLEPADLLLLYSDGLLDRPGTTATRSTVELATRRGGRGDRATALRRAGPGGRPTGLPPHPGPPGPTPAATTTTSPCWPHTGCRRLLPFSATLPAQPSSVTRTRAAMADWLAPLELRPVDEMAVQHALDELMANVVNHAYADASTGQRHGRGRCRARCAWRPRVHGRRQRALAATRAQRGRRTRPGPRARTGRLAAPRVTGREARRPRSGIGSADPSSCCRPRRRDCAARRATAATRRTRPAARTDA